MEIPWFARLSTPMQIVKSAVAFFRVTCPLVASVEHLPSNDGKTGERYFKIAILGSNRARSDVIWQVNCEILMRSIQVLFDKFDNGACRLLCCLEAFPRVD